MKKITIEDGALLGLSEGAQMTFESSLNELIDNAFDAGAEEVFIDVDNEKREITLSAKEYNTLTSDKWGKLYKLGRGGEATSQGEGVGRHGQGHKYATSMLIGKNGKGEVRVDSAPVNGTPWAIIQKIDYTDPNHYTDLSLYDEEDGVTYTEIPNGHNFKITITGAKNVSTSDIINSKIVIGLRYREKIQEGKIIKFCGETIAPQDRLYKTTPVGIGDGDEDRTNYKFKILPWRGNKRAAKFEYVDLVKAIVSEYELIKYDGDKGKNKGVNATCRSGVEVVFHGITVIYTNLQAEFKKLTGLDLQPSAAGFRGRLTIYDKELYDTFFRGGNKSNVTVSNDFAEDASTIEIRREICEAHRAFLTAHKALNETTGRHDKYVDEVAKHTTVLFVNNGSEGYAFKYDDKVNTLYVNEGSNLFSKHKAPQLLLYAVMSIKEWDSTEDICRMLKQIDTNIG